MRYVCCATGEPYADLKFDASKYGGGGHRWWEVWRADGSGEVHLDEEFFGCGSGNSSWTVKRLAPVVSKDLRPVKQAKKAVAKKKQKTQKKEAGGEEAGGGARKKSKSSRST